MSAIDKEESPLFQRIIEEYIVENGDEFVDPAAMILRNAQTLANRRDCLAYFQFDA